MTPSPFLLSLSPLSFGMSRLVADVLVVLHLLFVAFVGLGGFLVLRRPWVGWIHLPAAVWGVGIEVTGRICVSHYLLPVLYPRGLTRGAQLVLAALVLGVNLVIYAVVLRRRRATGPRTSRGGGSPPAP